jgi:hypothetical protein
MPIIKSPTEPTAEADRGRHPGFPSFNVLAGGPGSLAERSATVTWRTFCRVPVSMKSGAAQACSYSIHGFKG